MIEFSEAWARSLKPLFKIQALIARAIKVSHVEISSTHPNCAVPRVYDEAYMDDYDAFNEQMHRLHLYDYHQLINNSINISNASSSSSRPSWFVYCTLIIMHT